MMVTLPLGALIKAIRFRKQAGGSSTTAYSLYATDASIGPVYCSSAIAAQNSEHKAFADNLNIITTNNTNRAVYIFRSLANPGAAVATKMGSGDYAMVDYY